MLGPSGNSYRAAI